MRDALPDLKIFKPDHSELVHRVYSPVTGNYTMVFGVLAPFTLQPPGHTTNIAPSSIWEQAAAVLSKSDILDEGWPKPVGEFLAAGHCYMPHGHTSQPVSAHISVGSLNKQLAVFGRRTATLTGAPSAPEPFQRIALSHAHAFGGERHEYNPDGKGLPNADGELEFPNIELPAHLMISASDRPPVAGFGPLPAAWPERARHLGKQDQHWRDTRWPHLPEDSSSLYFMAAAPDQHLPQGYWAGGERIQIQNMHPDFPLLEGEVPRLRPRFFVHQSHPDGNARMRELHVQIDTVWMLPEQQLGIMIFRCGLPVSDPDGRDINAFYAAFEEPEAAPLPIEAYAQSCLKAMAPHLFQDMPDTVSPEFHASIQALGVSGLQEKLRGQREYFLASLQEAEMDETQLLELLQANPHTRQFAQLLQERHNSVSGFFDEIKDLLQEFEDDDAFSEPAASPSAQPTPNDVLTPYPPPAEHATRTPPPQAQNAALHDAGAAARNRQIVVNAVANGYSCANLDLTHANLAGLNLSGVDFSGAILAGANLAGAQLQGANLTSIYAEGARFDAANLAGCQLTHASLGGASFNGAVLRGANLDASDCSAANFSGAELSSASLRSASLSQAWLQGIRAEQLVANQTRFDHANLDNAQLPGALLQGADFSGASAQRINLEAAVAIQANFSQADFSGANLAKAQLSDSQTGPGSSLEKARLDHAVLENAGWSHAKLNDASFIGVQARGADFSDCSLNAARFHKADLRNCSFDRAVLEGTDLSASNLMQASFIHSRMPYCNFDYSNLYNATFKDPDIAGASFRQANLERTLLATP